MNENEYYPNIDLSTLKYTFNPNSNSVDIEYHLKNPIESINLTFTISNNDIVQIIEDNMVMLRLLFQRVLIVL